MIDIINCSDCNRLKLQIGKKWIHISWKEAKYLLKKLKENKVEKRREK